MRGGEAFDAGARFSLSGSYWKVGGASVVLESSISIDPCNVDAVHESVMMYVLWLDIDKNINVEV